MTEKNTGLLKCKGCGTVFMSASAKELCPDCQKEREEKWERIRRYLDENPASTIDVLSEKTGVSEKEIINFLREGRLVPTEEMQISYSCELCGKTISTGRYCNDCKSKMADTLEVLVEAMASDEKTKKKAQEVVRKVRMHTADLTDPNKR